MTFTIIMAAEDEPHLENVPALADEGHVILRLPKGSGWTEELIAQFGPVADAYAGMFVQVGLPAAVLERSPRLRVVVSPIIGVDHIDVAAATRLGIVVAHGAMAENFDGMAEAGVMLVAALRKQLPAKVAALAGGSWRPAPTGRLVQGMTVGIVGLGRIGRGMVRRLAGWGARIVAYDPYVDPADAAALGVEMLPLDAVMRTSDAVVVLVTLSAETYRLIDAAAIAAMKPGACLVNIGRGGTVDEAALLEALDSGRLAGAAIDTWETEPLPAGHPLLTHPKVIPTGHVVGHSAELYETAPRVAVENLRRGLRGETPLHVRNPAVLADWQARIARLG